MLFKKLSADHRQRNFRVLKLLDFLVVDCRSIDDQICFFDLSSFYGDKVLLCYNNIYFSIFT